MKTLMIRCVTFLVVFVLASVAPVVVKTGLAAEKEPIKLGFMYPMSGGAALYGQNSAAATELAMDEINKAGGVLGRPLEMIVRDTKLSPDVGVREAKDLVLNQKVFMLTGGLSSGVVLAISAYAKEQKMLYFTNIAQTAKLTNEDGHRYFFRWATNTTTLNKSTAKAAAKYWGDKKVAFIGPDYELGKSTYELFWKFYPQYVPDAVSVGEVWVPLGAKDLSPYITKLMGLDAEMVASVLYGGMQLAFNKAAKPFELYKKFHFLNTADDTTSILYPAKPGEPSSEGTLFCDRFPLWKHKSDPFVEKFKKKMGRPPEVGAVCQYISTHALADIINEIKSLDIEKIIDALEGRVFDTALGKIEMRACDHQLLVPIWVGIQGYTSDYPYLRSTQLDKFDNPYVNYETCEEVMRLRKK